MYFLTETLILVEFDLSQERLCSDRISRDINDALAVVNTEGKFPDSMSFPAATFEISSFTCSVHNWRTCIIYVHVTYVSCGCGIISNATK